MASRPELNIVEETPHFVSVILDGDYNLSLHYSSGDASVFTKNPEGPRIIEYMASIAPNFGGLIFVRVNRRGGWVVCDAVTASFLFMPQFR